MTSTRPLPDLNPAVVAIMLAGPAVTVALATRIGHLAPVAAAVAALIFWLPFLPISAPALLTQNQRDLARHHNPQTAGSVAALYLHGPRNLLAANWANIAGLALAALLLI